MNARDDAAAQALAERVRDTMYATDRAAHALGMEVVAVGPGTASVAMTVREEMLNGFGSCQGGLIATLADMAFAYACNSWNEMTVASGFEIELLGPARAGDRLVARGEAVSQGARLGVYDIHVSNQRGERIALFRGRSYRLKGKPVALS